MTAGCKHLTKYSDFNLKNIIPLIASLNKIFPSHFISLYLTNLSLKQGLKKLLSRLSLLNCLLFFVPIWHLLSLDCDVENICQVCLYYVKLTVNHTQILPLHGGLVWELTIFLRDTEVSKV